MKIAKNWYELLIAPRCKKICGNGLPCCLEVGHVFACLPKSPPPRPRTKRGMRRKADYLAHMEARKKYGVPVKSKKKEEKPQVA